MSVLNNSFGLNLSQLDDVDVFEIGQNQILSYVNGAWTNTSQSSMDQVGCWSRATGTISIGATPTTLASFDTVLQANTNFNLTTGVFTVPANGAGLYQVSCPDVQLLLPIHQNIACLFCITPQL